MSVVTGIGWDETWQRRADAMRERINRGDPIAEYRREDDPLFEVDLLTVWKSLTGEEPRYFKVRCPSPHHDDKCPSCIVNPTYFNCFACPAGGSIIDLGALLYGETPRGAGFHRIRERLLAELGMA